MKINEFNEHCAEVAKTTGVLRPLVRNVLLAAYKLRPPHQQVGDDAAKNALELLANGVRLEDLFEFKTNELAVMVAFPRIVEKWQEAKGIEVDIASMAQQILRRLG